MNAPLRRASGASPSEAACRVAVCHRTGCCIRRHIRSISRVRFRGSATGDGNRETTGRHDGTPAEKCALQPGRPKGTIPGLRRRRAHADAGFATVPVSPATVRPVFTASSLPVRMRTTVPDHISAIQAGPDCDAPAERECPPAMTQPDGQPLPPGRQCRKARNEHADGLTRCPHCHNRAGTPCVSTPADTRHTRRAGVRQHATDARLPHTDPQMRPGGSRLSCRPERLPISCFRYS